MLKPLTTEFKGRTVTLECTHKQAFPPPQMYGSTPEDIDNLWRQGRVDQGQYQHLTTWREACGLMIMGPRCLDCPLALKQNPRPGRPNVIETESWLDAKDKMRWDDMRNSRGEQAPAVPEGAVVDVNDTPAKKAGFVKKGAPVPVTVVSIEPGSVEEPTFTDVLAKGDTGTTTTTTTIEISEEVPKVEEPAKKKRSTKKRSKKSDAVMVSESESEAPVSASADTVPDKKPLEDAPGALDDSILDALADD